ncbi:TadE/TadG family type IV pilus assembly protein [Methylocystis heyeri]|uniref:TadE/TadG family type IV pilus assembly protein n=1 Tax=Methylocystis heyeri TaxID=391905 RepID=UPI001389916A|nr:TadE/TadG family type IV pilus assembly protein [Methylocystis heyeri]
MTLRRRIACGTRLFVRSQSGVVGVTFGIILIPMMLMLGVTIDYSRAARAKLQLQDALDSAVLAGASASSSNLAAAQSVFSSNTPNDGRWGNVNVTFNTSGAGITGTASIQLPVAFTRLLGLQSMNIAATSSAGFPSTTTAPGVGYCLVTLGANLSTTTYSLVLNGAPSWNLAGCNIVSNTSMNCNGHGGGANASVAVGSVSSCTHPGPTSGWIDTYASRASAITTVCGGANNAVNWTVGGAIPSDPDLVVVRKSSYTEYHVCGDLNLSGTGSLPSNSVFVIENGNLNVGKYANVTASQAAFVLTGSNSANHQITFPTGQGQAATLTVEAPTSASNPWQGIAVFVDPALTSGVSATWGVDEDDTWGPGATFGFDGVVYMPHTDLTLNGNTQSSAENCAMLVVNSFTANGTAVINFTQSASGCATAGVTTPGITTITPAALTK